MITGVLKLIPLMSSYGFSHETSDSGTSSGGRFATVKFTKDALEIGLIVRFGSELGCPNYSEGKGYAGHCDLMSFIDPCAVPKLVPNGSISYCSAQGGDPFEALLYDLEHTILPALKKDSIAFSSALAKAHGKFQRKLKGGG